MTELRLGGGLAYSEIMSPRLELGSRFVRIDSFSEVRERRVSEAGEYQKCRRICRSWWEFHRDMWVIYRKFRAKKEQNEDSYGIASNDLEW